MSHRWCAALLLLAAWRSFVAGAATPPTLEDAWRAALLRDPEVQAAALRVDATRAREDAARSFTPAPPAV
nr:hypothetical protein [Burkholderiales bacterium]